MLRVLFIFIPSGRFDECMSDDRGNKLASRGDSGVLRATVLVGVVGCLLALGFLLADFTLDDVPFGFFTGTFAATFVTFARLVEDADFSFSLFFLRFFTACCLLPIALLEREAAGFKLPSPSPGL